MMLYNTVLPLVYFSQLSAVQSEQSILSHEMLIFKCVVYLQTVISKLLFEVTGISLYPHLLDGEAGAGPGLYESEVAGLVTRLGGQVRGEPLLELVDLVDLIL